VKVTKLVEEEKNKTISSGTFGFNERLRILLTDKTKHYEAFDVFLKEKNLALEKMLKKI